MTEGTQVWKAGKKAGRERTNLGQMPLCRLVQRLIMNQPLQSAALDLGSGAVNLSLLGLPEYEGGKKIKTSSVVKFRRQYSVPSGI